MRSADWLSPPLDRAWIAARIPHSGAMCLLDEVAAFSDEAILCTATSHRDPRNPLSIDGYLAAVCGIEYAAQAMAVHGAILGALAHRPRMGYLASLRNVDAQIERLDTLGATLAVEAVRMGGDANNVLYRFALRCDDRIVLNGRAAVILDACAANLPLPDDAATA